MNESMRLVIGDDGVDKISMSIVAIPIVCSSLLKQDGIVVLISIERNFKLTNRKQKKTAKQKV